MLFSPLSVTDCSLSSSRLSLMAHAPVWGGRPCPLNACSLQTMSSKYLTGECCLKNNQEQAFKLKINPKLQLLSGLLADWARSFSVHLWICETDGLWWFLSARQKFVRKAWEKAEVSAKWAQSSWAKKIEARQKVKTKYCHCLKFTSLF